MAHYAGLDVSDKDTAIHVVENGKLVWRGKRASEPEVLAAGPAPACARTRPGRARDQTVGAVALTIAQRSRFSGDLEGAGFAAQVMHLAGGRSTGGVTGQAPLAGFHELSFDRSKTSSGQCLPCGTARQHCPRRAGHPVRCRLSNGTELGPGIGVE